MESLFFVSDRQVLNITLELQKKRCLLACLACLHACLLDYAAAGRAGTAQAKSGGVVTLPATIRVEPYCEHDTCELVCAYCVYARDACWASAVRALIRDAGLLAGLSSSGPRVRARKSLCTPCICASAFGLTLAVAHQPDGALDSSDPGVHPRAWVTTPHPMEL